MIFPRFGGTKEKSETWVHPELGHYQINSNISEIKEFRIQGKHYRVHTESKQDKKASRCEERWGRNWESQ